MSPRLRETSDEQILTATMRVMTRLNPLRLTLADVAKEAGVVPATLVQRFGTKRGLLLAAARCGATGVEQPFAAARDKYRSPMKALVEVLVECTSFAASPEAMANGLAYLQNDLTDPDFHAIALEQAVRLRAAIKRLLDEAVRTRQLVSCNTTKLARLVEITYSGSMLSWAIYREGTLAAWVRLDLGQVLAPYRRARK